MYGLPHSPETGVSLSTVSDGKIPHSEARQYWDTVFEAAAFLKSQVEMPRVVLTLGSGLDGFQNLLKNVTVIPFEDIPGLGFLKSSDKVEGHVRELCIGDLNGQRILVQRGRLHMHEGYNAGTATFLPRALAHAGGRDFIFTNAAGSLSPEIEPGDMVAVTGTIQMFVPDPTLGLTDERAGSRFSPVCSLDHQASMRFANLATEAGINVHHGAYVQLTGPSYEDPAEIAMLAFNSMLMGNSKLGEALRAEYGSLFSGLATSAPLYRPMAIGMSTGVEARALEHYNGHPERLTEDRVRYVIFSAITNKGAGLSPTPPNHEEVVAEGAKLAPKLKKAMSAFLNGYYTH